MHKLVVIPAEPLSDAHSAIIQSGLTTHEGVIVAVNGDPEAKSRLFMEKSARQSVMATFSKKILICGLSGSGKTTLARELAPLIDAIHLNNDEIREGPHDNFGWTEENRIIHARKVGQWADILVRQGHHVIVDMICPTLHTRAALDPDFTVFLDTVSKSAYMDTDALFAPPPKPDYVIKSKNASLWAKTLALKLDRRILFIDIPSVGEVVKLQAE